MGRRVFVSYSRSDRRLARELVKQLKAAGHMVWIDESGIDAGEVWAREIVEAIRSSQVFVLLATTSSVRSNDVKKEVGLAGKFGRPIVPAVVPPVRIPSEIGYHIAGRHHVTIDPDNSAASFAALAATLDEVKSGKSLRTSWIPAVVVLLLAALAGLGIWTAASGALPPWNGRGGCESVTAEVVAASPARFGTFESGATLDIEVRNHADRAITLPPGREATAAGASGRQYPPETSLADTSWFQSIEVQPGLTSRLQLGLSSPAAGSDTVTVTIHGVQEAAFPLFKCDVTIPAVLVSFAGG